MKILITAIALLFVIVSCNNKTAEKANETDNNKIIVKEVLQTGEYTYVNGTVGDKDQWFAIPTMDAKVGDTYYYEGGLVMNNFESKDLKRTFDNILFLEGLSTNPIDKNAEQKEVSQTAHAAAKNLEKVVGTLTPVEGAITIGELFTNKKNYADKSVKVNGVVVKFSEGIMNKNWIHLQDGTDGDGKYDLTITTLEIVAVGDTLSLEGKITLDKDLGMGYFYEVIMEDAVAK
ncbi:MAG: hypothetical protein A2033_01725 [Bacteroidetes bacterium GWA2_31_9]|nr:MAG: hypothetical protein A2033_01725 [Bacteroidetes bacterium GWA2_31_9]